MPVKSDKARAKESQRRYRKNVDKLQRAGLLGKVNLRLSRDPKARRAIIKYKDYLGGKVAAVKAPSSANASYLKGKYALKGRGNIVLVPKEKREKIKITKQGEVISTRPNPLNKSETITRKYSEKGVAPPKEGERVYYTIRERKRGLGTLKRTTFAKFDDLLEYLAAYDINWDDVEPYFETETISEHGRKAGKYDKTISEERSAGHKRWARRHARKSKVVHRSKRKTNSRKPKRNKTKTSRSKHPSR